MKPNPYPPTPECDKLSAVKDQSQIIGAFLDHLSQEGIEFCIREGKYDDLVPLNQSIEVTLAKYFDIDLKKVEQERQAILDYIRTAK